MYRRLLRGEQVVSLTRGLATLPVCENSKFHKVAASIPPPFEISSRVVEHAYT